MSMAAVLRSLALPFAVLTALTLTSSNPAPWAPPVAVGYEELLSHREVSLYYPGSRVLSFSGHGEYPERCQATLSLMCVKADVRASNSSLRSLTLPANLLAERNRSTTTKPPTRWRHAPRSMPAAARTSSSRPQTFRTHTSTSLGPFGWPQTGTPPVSHRFGRTWSRLAARRTPSPAGTTEHSRPTVGRRLHRCRTVLATGLSLGKVSS